MKNRFKPNVYLFFLLVSITVGCSKEPETEPLLEQGIATIDVEINGTSFEAASTIEPFGIMTLEHQNYVESAISSVQIQQTELSKDMNLIAELNELKPSDTPSSHANVSLFNERIEISYFEPLVRYKLLIFSSPSAGSGDHLRKFVTSRDYVYTREVESPPLLLDGGSDYTFIAYSINSKTDLPDFSFSNPSHPDTWSLDQVLINDLVKGQDDFMYFRKDMAVTGKVANKLQVRLKHMFSELTVKLNSGLVQLPINGIGSSTLSSSYRTTSIRLHSGEQGNPKGVAAVSFTFPTITGNDFEVTSTPIILNTIPNSRGQYLCELNIVRLRVGEVFRDVMLSDFHVIPGRRYNLLLRLVRKDAYVTYDNKPAVRIAGKIWARHNLGVNVGLDPDALATTDEWIGHWYHWGEKNPAAVGAVSPYGDLLSWLPLINASQTRWNTQVNNNLAPVKNVANDPCGENWRVPTASEYDMLINTTNLGARGTWKSSNDFSDFSSARSYVSKTNPDVMISFPIAGYRDNIVGSGALNKDFNQVGLHWTSTSANTDEAYVFHSFGPDENRPVDDDLQLIIKNMGLPIRCVSKTDD